MRACAERDIKISFICLRTFGTVRVVRGPFGVGLLWYWLGIFTFLLTYLFTYLLTYLLTYLFTYLLTHSM